MKYENRHDPYRFFDELRKTPVVQVADKVYVVTGYRELLQLAHDPHVSSDISKSPISAQPAADAPDVGADHMQAYGREPSLIVSDPAKHDRQRRQVMRHFAPPHSPNVIPNMEPTSRRCATTSLDKVKAKGGNTFDVVDEYAYPVPVAVICKILGVPLKDEPTFHGWIFDFMAGADMGPDAATEEGQARLQKGRESMAAITQYMADLIQGFLTEPGDNVLSKLVNDKDGPDGPMTPEEAAANAQLLLIAGHDSTVNTIAHCVLITAAQPRVDRAAAREAGTDSQGDRGGPAAAVGRPVLPQPQRHRRHRGRRDRHPRGFGGAPAVRRRQPRSQAIPRPGEVRHPAPGQPARGLGSRSAQLRRRSAGTPGGQHRVGDVPAPRREPAAGRRPAALPARTRSSAARCISRSSSTGSRTEVAPSRPSSSSNGSSRANFVTCRCPSRGRGRCWSRSAVPVPAIRICICWRRPPDRSR